MDDYVKKQCIEIGERIRETRRKKHMTMKELGAAIDLHESTISYYEHGKIGSIDIERLKRMADVLGVSPEWLIGWDKPNSMRDEIISKLDVLTDNELRDLYEYINFIISKRR